MVVGSGFGGAVTAYRLADAGYDVLVLERGRAYPPGSFARTPSEASSAFWDPAEDLYGLFELWSFDHLSAVCASGLGGGSLIYANVMLRKPEDTFVREDLAGGGRESWPITAEELREHYDRVWEMQQPQRYPYDTTPKTRAVEAAARTIGLAAERPELAVLFAPAAGDDAVPGAPVPGDNLHHLPRTTCRLSGECNVGCNYGAKNTLDYTYLSAAQQKGATIRTGCEVRTIEPIEGGKQGFDIGYRQHLLGPRRDGQDPSLLDPSEEPFRTVRSSVVVLGAGSIGSTRLLLANRTALPGLSAALGTRVSANGDAIAWVRDADRSLQPSRGPVITTSIDVPEGRSPSGRGYHVQDAGAPAIGDWFWGATQLPTLPWRLRRTIVRLVRRALARRPDTNLSAEVAALFGGSSDRVLPLLGLGRDVPDGRYVLDRDRLVLDWDAHASEDHYRAVEATFHDIAAALGGKLSFAPTRRFNRTTTVHPLGGCPMADSARHGVVDAHGCVFGFHNLYVADGAAMPGPVGPNPSWTIAAFADRVADGIIDRNGGGG